MQGIRGSNGLKLLASVAENYQIHTTAQPYFQACNICDIPLDDAQRLNQTFYKIYPQLQQDPLLLPVCTQTQLPASDQNFNETFYI